MGQQRTALVELGCRLGQVYHFARPETPENIAQRLADVARTARAPSPV